MDDIFFSTGKIVYVIKIPAQVCGSLAWGGKNLDILFVTTYSKVRNIFTGENEDVPFTAESGQLFMVTGLNDKGFPARKACISCNCCKQKQQLKEKHCNQDNCMKKKFTDSCF